MVIINIGLKRALIVFIIFIINGLIEGKKNVDKCESCDKLVKNFIQNLDKTQKGNFGGGNTDWEDRKLGNYLYSETRFEEILDNICEDDSECNSSIEEFEDYLFDWFKNKQKKIKSELYSHFCIKTQKSCCTSDSFGPKCDKCPQINDKTCGGNGKCDGDGTRKGNGKCKCNTGFGGDMCEKCKNGYFQIEANNDKTIRCVECHRSCKSTCIKDGPDGCIDCNDGWLFNEGKCEDVDECKQAHICSNGKFCVNNEGSYSCLNCDNACKTCTSNGNQNCIDCNEGYEENSENSCIDINECDRNPGICGVDECVNTPGSYECKVNNEVEQQKQEERTEQQQQESINNNENQLNSDDSSVKAEL